MKRMAAFLMILLLLLPLSGCLNAHSLDRYGYVLAIAFDRGEEMPYKITLMLQNMQLSDDSQKSGGFTLVSAECRGLYEAIVALSSRLPHVLDFSRTMMLMFAQELVREAGVLEDLLSVSFSKLHIRYNAGVYVALSKASEVFEGLDNELEPNLTKIQMNHMLYARSTGLVPMTSLTLLQEAIQQRYEDAALPVCGNADYGSGSKAGSKSDGYGYIGGTPLVDSDMKTGLAGAALFSGGRMAGLIDGEQTQLLLMVLGEFKEGRIRLSGGDAQETNLLVSADAMPRVELAMGPAPTATVSIRLRVTLEQPESVDTQRMNDIVSQLEAQLENGLVELLALCQAIESDAMGFGRHAVKRFSSVEDWRACDWAAAYQRLSVSFAVTAQMEQTAVKTVLE